jgi:hypothetical protein
VVQGFGPQTIRDFYERLRSSPIAQIGGLLAAWWIFPVLFDPVWSVVRGLLYL